VARCLYRQRGVDDVWWLHEGTLREGFVDFVCERGPVDWLGDVQCTAVQREMASCIR
jgi:hypothetical protein